MTFSGLYTALITPFNDTGELDVEGLRRIVRDQRKARVSGVVTIGTTGEAYSLTNQEKIRIVKAAREEISEDMQLIVGCGTPSTASTIETLAHMADLGADSALVVTPFYNKPTQEGLFLHYKALSKATPIPIIVYNNPTRTAVNIETSTLKRIAELPHIVGVKQSSVNLVQLSEVIFEIQLDRPNFSVFTGEDSLIFPMIALGAGAVISSTANLIPSQLNRYVHTCLSGHMKEAQKEHFALFPLFEALCCQPNPIPLKAAMNMCGLPARMPRLPLTPLADGFIPQLKAVLENLGLTAVLV